MASKMTVIDLLDTYIPFSKQISGFFVMILTAIIGAVFFKLGLICEIMYNIYPNEGFTSADFIAMSITWKILGLGMWCSYIAYTILSVDNNGAK